MAPPPIQLFLTTIASQPALRQRQEYLLRVLQVKKFPFTSYDLASDEEAKKLWRRKAPLDKQQLPGILVGGKFPGTFSDFEEAVECGEVDIFLRRNEDYDDDEDAKPVPPAKPVGVPGAYSPSQMHPKYNPSPSPQPSPLKGKTKEKDDKTKVVNAGEHLSEFGIHDVEVSEDDLRALVEELGLGGDEANDLVKGLGSDAKTTETSVKKESAPEAVVEQKELPKPAATEPETKQEPVKLADTTKADESEAPKEVKESGTNPEESTTDIAEITKAGVDTSKEVRPEESKETNQGESEGAGKPET